MDRFRIRIAHEREGHLLLAERVPDRPGAQIRTADADHDHVVEFFLKRLRELLDRADGRRFERKFKKTLLIDFDGFIHCLLGKRCS